MSGKDGVNYVNENKKFRHSGKPENIDMGGPKLFY
jgi:hypothetical protein